MNNTTTAHAVRHPHPSVTDYSTRRSTNSEHNDSDTPSDSSPIPHTQHTQARHLSTWHADQDTTGFSSKDFGPRKQRW